MSDQNPLVGTWKLAWPKQPQTQRLLSGIEIQFRPDQTYEIVIQKNMEADVFTGTYELKGDLVKRYDCNAVELDAFLYDHQKDVLKVTAGIFQRHLMAVAT